MSAHAVHLVLSPEKCNRCGHCIPACPRSLVSLGGGYVSVDTGACDGCGLCVTACSAGAIVRKVSAGRTTAGTTPAARTEAARTAVGSRAEAKALRQAAKVAEKPQARSAPKPAPKSAAAAPRRTTAAAERSHAARGSRAAAASAVPGPTAWGALDAVAVLAVLLLTFVAKEAVLGSTLFHLMPQTGQVAARGVVLGVFYAVQLGALVFLAHRHAATMPSAFGLTRRASDTAQALASVGIVVGLLVATRAFATLWGASAQAAGWNPPARGISELTSVFGSGGGGLALSVLMVVIVGPLTEELLFRGVLLGAAGARWGMWPAILGSSAVFALYHVTPWLFVPTFALGVALGWLAWTRRSLWPAITLHVLYNGVAVGAAFWLAR